MLPPPARQHTHPHTHLRTHPPACLQAEVDPATLDNSREFLARLRDSVLVQAGVSPANVKLVPLASNTATCE